jgi:hypothetical protein
LWFPKGENTHLGKSKRIWFGPFRVQYFLPSNTIILNYFKKLKPYKYIDQTLKGIQSSKYQTSLKSIDLNHREEKSDEHSEDQRTIKIIDINQTITLEEASVNLMS